MKNTQKKSKNRGYGVKSKKYFYGKDRPPMKFLRGQKSIGGYTSNI